MGRGDTPFSRIGMAQCVEDSVSAAEREQNIRGRNPQARVVRLSGFRDCDGFADMASRLPQRSRSLASTDSSGEHHQRYRRAIAAGFESAARGFVIGSGGALKDRDGALRELFVFRHDIDHQISIDVSQTSHRSGRDYIQNHFVRSAGLHARRSSKHFCADFGDDGEICGALQRRVAITGERDGFRAAMPREFESGNGERSASAGGNAKYNVVLARFSLRYFLAGELRVIFAGFGSAGQGFLASGHDELHGARVDIKSW